VGEAGMVTGPWLDRTDEVLERSRLVLGALACVSLVFCTPYMIRAAGDDRPAIAICVPVVLASIVFCYRSRRVRPIIEALEAGCLCVVMAALPTPLTAFIFLFPLLWCRALYGGGFQMLLRSLLYMIGTLLSVPLSSVLSQPVEPDLTTFLAVSLASIIFIGVAGRQLAVGMRAHDDGARRERLVSASGTRLLGITDRDEIRRISEETMAELVDGFPDLRLLIVERTGDGFSVRQALGPFTALPSEFTAAELALPPGGPVVIDAPVDTLPVLDRAAHRRCRWQMQSFLVNGRQVVLFLGHPGRGGPDIGLTARTVINQSALALQNSDVHQQLTTQALTDGLTGLANRQGFTEATRRMISAAGGTPIAVLFIDLDDFKEVNDTLGHAVGDELLQQVAGLLSSVTRADDVVARLGGDEFAVLLKNTPQSVAEQVAERVVLGIAVLSLANGTDLGVGSSIGVAMADDSTRLENLLVHADVAMYAAKADGKGRVRTYHPGLLPPPGPIEP
jgi:diguanylate cyclase (GGDEF)-like protein